MNRLGRKPRPVAGAHREDHVAVEEGVGGSNPDRQRIVAELRELAALGAVEVRIGPDDDERRVAGGRRLRSARGVDQRGPVTSVDVSEGVVHDQGAERRAVGHKPSRTSDPSGLCVVGSGHLRDGRAGPGTDPPFQRSHIPLSGERRGIAGIGVGSRQRVTDPEVEEDRGRDDRHRPHAGREPDATLCKAAHDAVGGGQPECRAAGEADRVDSLDEGRRTKEVGLASARRRASDVDARDRSAVRSQDDSAAGEPGRIGPVADAQPGNVAQGEAGHRPILYAAGRPNGAGDGDEEATNWLSQRSDARGC